MFTKNGGNGLDRVTILSLGEWVDWPTSCLSVFSVSKGRRDTESERALTGHSCGKQKKELWDGKEELARREMMEESRG